MIIRFLEQHGHKVQDRKNSRVDCINLSKDTLETFLSDRSRSSQKPDIHVFILPDSSADRYYAQIKSLTDRGYPMHSLCCLAWKVTGVQMVRVRGQLVPRRNQKGLEVRNPPFDYLSNLCLKICMKLGGVPWKPEEKSLEELFAIDEAAREGETPEPLQPKLTLDTIIIGADLTHPGSASGRPSIAALVGSIDDSFARFPGSMRLTPAREEIISAENLAAMVAERLRSWSRYNSGRLPSKILFYRDGAEHDEQADADQKLELTFVVVVKRHHTRFFPLTSRDVVGSQGYSYNTNLKPGLLVRDEVTTPRYPNFYLQSHNAIQGTARPAHYVVLEKAPSLEMHNLEKITNALCNAFPRATKGVSYCAPAYLADRLCERGATYLSQWAGLDDYIAHCDELRRKEYTTRAEQKEWFAKVARYLNVVFEARKHWIPETSDGQNPWAAMMDDVMFYM
ncbi:uncharacterized protein PV09_09225 [Verruconis gallopava]|uniref:Piwi domain-containing protein n=1 Tax=Verruconis gallopava TaxID=253628 RepID=A0A0D2AJG3_9PEZI|nr:uncharacterized protein PV09_09225 [Verruconis gallopava]KIV99053.1 hypothetical protein PV09_09225 [Verruconis gallopava]